MIGWKCDISLQYASTYTWEKLSDIPIAQKDAYFTILTPGDLSNMPLKPGQVYDFNLVGARKMAGEIEEYLKSEYYYIYTYPVGTYNQRHSTNQDYILMRDLLQYIAPSYQLMSQASIEFIDNEEDKNKRHTITYIIYTLKRVFSIIDGASSRPQCRIWKINDDETLTILAGSNSSGLDISRCFNYWNTDAVEAFYSMCILNYTDYSSLFEVNNYCALYVGYVSKYPSGVKNPTYYKEVPQSSNENNDSNMLQALFGEGTKPDFEGDLPGPPDPLDPIGPSGPGGGNGNFDPTSDIIGDSSLPTISAADTGFTRIYSPTLSQVQDLAQYLWTDETVVETIWNKIKQLLENPMDAIISFSLVPVPVQISGTKNFALAYIDTGVAMNTVANQFVDVDCGTFELKEYYGSALDYSPNTKVSCFLPFIGVVTLNTDEVMNTTLTIRYRVDIVSGSCVAKIFVNESCLYQFSGHCSIPIPISAADFSSYLSAAIGVAKLAIGAAVGGGAGAAAGASEVDVEQATRGVEISEGMSREQEMAAYQNAFDTYRENNQSAVTTASFRGISAQNVTNVVGTVMGSKLHVEHSGSFSGNTGYLGIRRPYLIIQRPRMCMPDEYRSFNGYPSMITLNIGDCKGYTKVQQVQLKNVPATNPEQSEIMQLLKGGIII